MTSLTKQKKRGSVCERSVIIYLSAGRTVKADSFADAIKQPHVNTEEPLGFRARLESSELQALVSLTKLAQNLVQPISSTQFQVQQYSPQLKFNVKPRDTLLAQELFGALQNWAADFAPSTWMRVWSRYHSLFAFLLIIWVLGGLTLGFFDVKVPSGSYLEQAHKIVEEGVNDKNQHKAIEIILAIESHDPGVSKSIFASKPGRRYWGVSLVWQSLLSA